MHTQHTWWSICARETRPKTAAAGPGPFNQHTIIAVFLACFRFSVIWFHFLFFFFPSFASFLLVFLFSYSFPLFYFYFSTSWGSKKFKGLNKYDYGSYILFTGSKMVRDVKKNIHDFEKKYFQGLLKNTRFKKCSKLKISTNKSSVKK